ncbi:hypothetical protein DL546_002617 [Coniochaeta pulveracea]|uniref:Uncharacterized protein n=1 Tax=Coniochaeta pulveracea TaxID=177199 RepID=A0A420Y8A8_9PEZI|nr:hypothetical protein DL546_002617 [Coniochaeta pulveracea]
MKREITTIEADGMSEEEAADTATVIDAIDATSKAGAIVENGGIENGMDAEMCVTSSLATMNLPPPMVVLTLGFSGGTGGRRAATIMSTRPSCSRRSQPDRYQSSPGWVARDKPPTLSSSPNRRSWMM